MIIPFNKRRAPLVMGLLLVAIAACSWGFWYGLRKPDLPTAVGVPPFLGWLLPVTSGLAAGLWLLTLTNYLRTLLNPNATLTIDKEGITDRLTYYSVGQVPWRDITDIRLISLYGVSLLVVGLKQPHRYVDNARFLRWYVLRGALKRWGSPFVIARRAVRYDLSALHRVLLEQQAQASGAAPNS